MSPLYVGGAIHYGNKSSAPTSPTPTEGSTYYHTSEDKKYLYDGTNWASFDVTGPYAGGTATNWWKSSGLTGNDGWTAEKGGKNLTRYGTDDLVYTASDSAFNNKKTIKYGSDARLAYNGSNGSMWNTRAEPFSVMAVTRKLSHNHAFGKGDALFTHMDSNTAHQGSWSLEPYGDHVWTNGGEIWNASSVTITDPPGSIGSGISGIWLAKFDGSGNGGMYWWEKNGTAWETIATSSGWTSTSKPADATGVSLFMAASTATNHRYNGIIADVIYWKGTKIGDTQRDAYKDYAVAEFGF